MLEPIPPKTYICPMQDSPQIRAAIDALRPECRVFHISGAQYSRISKFQGTDYRDSLWENIAFPFPVFAMKMDPIAYYLAENLDAEGFPIPGAYGTGTIWVIVDTREKYNWKLYTLKHDNLMDGNGGYVLFYNEMRENSLTGSMDLRIVIDAADRPREAKVRQQLRELYNKGGIIQLTTDQYISTINVLQTGISRNAAINFCHLLTSRSVRSTAIADPMAEWSRQMKRAISWSNTDHYTITMRNPKITVEEHIQRALSYIAKKREHWVRGHKRHLRSGKDIIVPAHKRGVGNGKAAEDVAYNAKQYLSSAKA